MKNIPNRERSVAFQRRLRCDKDNRTDNHRVIRQKLASIFRKEGYTLVSLDADFADIRTYPHNQFSGIIETRLSRQDKLYVIDVFWRALPLPYSKSVKGYLWLI